MPGGTNLAPSPDHPPGVARHIQAMRRVNWILGRDLERLVHGAGLVDDRRVPGSSAGLCCPSNSSAFANS